MEPRDSSEGYAEFVYVFTRYECITYHDASNDISFYDHFLPAVITGILTDDIA